MDQPETQEVGILRSAETGLTENRAISPQRTGMARVIGSAFICELTPLPQPTVAQDLARMTAIERTVESLRYNFFLLEYSLAKNGWLRAWLLSTLRVLVLLVIPLCAFSVLVGILVPTMAGLAAVFGSLEIASKSMFWAVVHAILTCALIAAAVAFVGVLLRMRSQGSR